MAHHVTQLSRPFPSLPEIPSAQCPLDGPSRGKNEEKTEERREKKTAKTVTHFLLSSTPSAKGEKVGKEIG
jgi:hypothetical protein